MFSYIFGKTPRRISTTVGTDPDSVSGLVRRFNTGTGRVWVDTFNGGTEAVANGDLVGSIRDKINASTYIPAFSSGNKGTLRTSTGPGGVRYIEFSATTKFRESFTLANGFTRFNVFRVRTGTTLGNYMIGGASVLDGLLQPLAGPNIRLYSGSGGPSLAFALDTWYVSCEVYNGASSVLSLNGGTEATGNPGTNAPSGLSLGDTSFPTLFDWCETIIYNTVLGLSTRTGIVSNLKAYYGIA